MCCQPSRDEKACEFLVHLLLINTGHHLDSEIMGRPSFLELQGVVTTLIVLTLFTYAFATFCEEYSYSNMITRCKPKHENHV